MELRPTSQDLGWEQQSSRGVDMDAMLDLDYGFSLGPDSGIIRWLVKPTV